MIKKTVAFSLIAGFVIFVAVLFFSNITEVSKAVFSLPFYQFLIVLAIFLVNVLLVTYRWKIILKAQGYDIPFKKAFPAKVGCYAISYLTPFSRLGGEPIRAYIIKKKANVPFLKGFETTIEDKMIEFTSTIVFDICGILILLMSYTLSRNAAITIIAFSVFFVLLLGFFYFQIIREKEFFSILVRMFQIHKIKAFPEIHSHAKKLEKNISSFFLNHKKTIIKCLLISSLASMVLLLNSMLLMHFMGYKLSFAGALIIYALTAFATAVPIPGALGTYEGFSALAFGILGFTAGTGVAFILLIRLTELSLVAIGVFFVYHYSIKLLISFLTTGD